MLCRDHGLDPCKVCDGMPPLALVDVPQVLAAYRRGLITLSELVEMLSEIDRAETVELLRRGRALRGRG